MIKVNTSFTQKNNSNEMKKMMEALKQLKDKEVLVGIPQDKNEEHDNTNGLTNAELLYIHDKGSPINNIPARPTLEPALENEKEYLGEMLGEVLKQTMDGNTNVTQQLEEIGMEAQNICRDWFTNPANNWAPNSPYTIKQKGSSNPLIDTGELRKSITYAIKEGKQ